MLYLLSISVTLVGAATLVALILFSHRDDGSERTELYESGEREPMGGAARPSRTEGGAREAEHPREGGLFENDSPSAGRSEREGEAGSPGKRTRTSADEAGARASVSDASAAGPAVSIPILRPGTPIPGLGRFELVHFLGKAEFGTVEDDRDLEDIHIGGNGPPLELKGELALTSKHIVVFDAQTTKKIPFGVIEKYRFDGSFLIVKKKNVKKKKTLLKIFVNAGDFRYILGVLIPL